MRDLSHRKDLSHSLHSNLTSMASTSHSAVKMKFGKFYKCCPVYEDFVSPASFWAPANITDSLSYAVVALSS